MFVPITSIIVEPSRHRKIFEQKEVDSLAVSLQEYGILHPPVVKQNDEGVLVLMAGERRLRAAKKLMDEGKTIKNVPQGMIPYTLFEHVDALLAKEIELEENLRRVDLSWKETAAATAELHRLRQAQNPGWTQTQTMEEIKERGGPSLSPVTIRNRVMLADNLHRPTVASATSEAQAMKNLARELENEFKAALVMQGTPRSSKHILECLPAVEGIKAHVAPGSVDVIITDPPYGIEATSFGLEQVAQVHTYVDDWEQVCGMLWETLVACTTAVKPQAHLYMFCDYSHYEEVVGMLEDLEWDVWNRPLIWVKNTGYTPRPDYGPRRNYECILFANRGKKMVTGVYSDVITLEAVTNKVHAAQKPVDLYKNLLSRSVIPGDTVLDPFCGSGPIFAAAGYLGLKAIGFDIDPTSVVNARRHL